MSSWFEMTALLHFKCPFKWGRLPAAPSQEDFPVHPGWNSLKRPITVTTHAHLAWPHASLFYLLILFSCVVSCAHSACLNYRGCSLCCATYCVTLVFGSHAQTSCRRLHSRPFLRKIQQIAWRLRSRLPATPSWQVYSLRKTWLPDLRPLSVDAAPTPEFSVFYQHCEIGTG